MLSSNGSTSGLNCFHQSPETIRTPSNVSSPRATPPRRSHSAAYDTLPVSPYGQRGLKGRSGPANLVRRGLDDYLKRATNAPLSKPFDQTRRVFETSSAPDTPILDSLEARIKLASQTVARHGLESTLPSTIEGAVSGNGGPIMAAMRQMRAARAAAAESKIVMYATLLIN